MGEGDRTENINIPDFEQLAEEIANVASDVLGKPILDYESNFTTLGIDSLSLLDILAVLESKFGVLFAESVVEEFYSVSRTARIVHDALRARRSEAPGS